MTLYNLQEKEQEQDQYDLDHNISRAPNDDLLDVIPDNSHFEYHTPGEWIYGHIPSTFYRMHFKRMKIDDKKIQFNLKMRTPNVFTDIDWTYPFPIKHIHIYQSKQNSNIYLVDFDFYEKLFHGSHRCSMSELINTKTKRILIGKYNVIFPTIASRFYWVTYTYDFLGNKFI